MTVVLLGLIGQFSATYLHRDRGFLRFYLLLHLFAFGSLLAFAAASFDLLIGGWEVDAPPPDPELDPHAGSNTAPPSSVADAFRN